MPSLVAKGKTKAKLIVAHANARAISESVIAVKTTPINDTTMNIREIRRALAEIEKNNKLYTKIPNANRMISMIISLY